MSGQFVTIQMNVAVEGCVSVYSILEFLNDKLKNDSAFFGELSMDNIYSIRPFEKIKSGRTLGELMDGHTLE